MSSGFEPRDPDYERRVLGSFARQGLLATFAARLETIEPGMVEIHVPFSTGLTQQDNFFHAGSFMPASGSPHSITRVVMRR
jgi:acyl-coenzyme A thioesterase PaaI-like protein